MNTIPFPDLLVCIQYEDQRPNAQQRKKSESNWKQRNYTPQLHLYLGPEGTDDHMTAKDLASWSAMISESTKNKLYLAAMDLSSTNQLWWVRPFGIIYWIKDKQNPYSSRDVEWRWLWFCVCTMPINCLKKCPTELSSHGELWCHVLAHMANFQMHQIP